MPSSARSVGPSAALSCHTRAWEWADPTQVCWNTSSPRYKVLTSSSRPQSAHTGFAGRCRWVIPLPFLDICLGYVYHTPEVRSTARRCSAVPDDELVPVTTYVPPRLVPAFQLKAAEWVASGGLADGGNRLAE